MLAKMLLTDNPSKDSVHGIVLFNNKGVAKKIFVSQRLLNDHGLIGVRNAVTNPDKKGLIRLSVENFAHNDPLQIPILVDQFAAKFNFGPITLD